MQNAGPAEPDDREQSPPAGAFQPLISRTHARTHERNETISRLGQPQGLRPPNLRYRFGLAL